MDKITSTKQLRIANVLRSLECINKVTVTRSEKDGVIQEIFIHHQQMYIPDFQLKWCPTKQHYRVYILVASTAKDKENAGYCICVLQSSLAATGFCTLYNFLHSHRANNKEDNS